MASLFSVGVQLASRDVGASGLVRGTGLATLASFTFSASARGLAAGREEWVANICVNARWKAFIIASKAPQIRRMNFIPHRGNAASQSPI